jgi:hypothetical protein
MEEMEDVEVQEEPAIEEDLPEEPVEVEEELQEEESETRPVYRQDVEEMVFRRRSEVSDLSKKLRKYVDNTEAMISSKQLEIRMLERVAEELPERPEIAPDIPFGEPPEDESEESAYVKPIGGEDPGEEGEFPGEKDMVYMEEEDTEPEGA